jgi:hypothetical protein
LISSPTSIHVVCSTDPLSNHIATLNEYFIEFKKQESSKERRDYFFRFAAYLVGQCWMKMRRRILHWSSQGFIHILSKADKAEMLQAFSFYEQSAIRDKLPKGRDLELGKLLTGMHEEGEIESVIMSKCGRPELSSEGLTNMVAAFKELQELSAEARGHELEVYNKETCWEFHKFLLATLLAYGKALNELGALDAAIRPNSRWKKKQKQSPQELDTLKGRQDQCAAQVWRCGIVLWRIAYSRILVHHLEALGMGGLLDQPNATIEKLELYRLSTGFSSISCPDVNWPKDSDGMEECSQEDECTQEDEEFSFARANEISSVEAHFLADMVLKWIRLNVTHWASHSVLSANARLNPGSEPLKIRLIVVKHPNPHNDFEAEPWKDTIRNVLAAGPHQSTYTKIPDADAVITTITGHITRACGAERLANSIFDAYRPQPDQEPDQERNRRGSTIHCETALVTLWAHPSELHSDDVKALIKVRVIHSCCLLIRLIHWTEARPEYNRSLKAVLPDLLGGSGHFER